MLNKKGFSLIELVAVIVILAIIAVITVPKIADMISSSRQGGAEDSFYGTLKAAELGYTKALQSNTNLKGSTCNIEDSKINCNNGVNIDVSGKTPESGIIALSANGVSGANIKLNGYKCTGTLSTTNPCGKDKGNFEADKLKEKIVTAGNGIYIDEYETNRFIYRGENPNNYLKFNNEIWRIISVEPDNSLKIIKDEKLATDMKYDDESRYNASNTYCTISTDGNYYGCNAWAKVDGVYKSYLGSGTVTQNASINDYLNGDYYNNLNTASKNTIISHDFNIGDVNYKPTLANTVTTEKQRKWKGNIGLINYSDYYKATINTKCEPDKNGYYQGNQIHDNYPCSFDNYLYKPYDWVTMNPYSSYSYGIMNIAGYGSTYLWYSNTIRSIRPVAFLKSDISITGTGTSSDPYIVS